MREEWIERMRAIGPAIPNVIVSGWLCQTKGIPKHWSKRKLCELINQFVWCWVYVLDWSIWRILECMEAKKRSECELFETLWTPYRFSIFGLAKKISTTMHKKMKTMEKIEPREQKKNRNTCYIVQCSMCWFYFSGTTLVWLIK